MSVSFLFALGLAAFMVGLRLLQTSLETMTLPQLNRVLTAMTVTPWKGFFLGTTVTAVVQSSSAVTAVAISLVNSGVIGFSRTIGLILGTNLGTTVTAQLFVFDLQLVAIPLLIIFLPVWLLARNRAQYLAARAGSGLSLVFLGLEVMTAAVSTLEHSPVFLSLLAITADHPFFALAAGVAITAIIQSSSSVTAMVIALTKAGLINLPSATAVVLGSNLGTCFTAVIAALPGTRAGKQVALAHVILNMLGILVFFPWLDGFAAWMAKTSTLLPRQVANAHLVFNLVSSLAVLPFSSAFARLINRLLPDTRS